MVVRAEIDAHRPEWSFEIVTLAAVGNGDIAGKEPPLTLLTPA